MDASVVVKWLLTDPAVEPDVDKAMIVLGGIRDDRLQPLRPPHWLAETAAVLARLNPAIAEEAIRLLYAMQIPVSDGLGDYERAVELAKDLGHHAFDTLYHAIALEHRATLITADEKYYRKARSSGAITLLQRFEEEHSGHESAGRGPDTLP